MAPFFTSALVAALATASLVQAAPAAKSSQKASAKKTSTDGPNLARDLATLQAFAQTITSDPQGIKHNWTAAGNDVCSFGGVTCAQHPGGYIAVAGIGELCTKVAIIDFCQANSATDFNGYKLGANLRLDGLMNRLTDLTFFHGKCPRFSHMENSRSC